MASERGGGGDDLEERTLDVEINGRQVVRI